MTSSDTRRLRGRRILILAGLAVVVLGISVLLGRYPGPSLTPLSAIENDALARDLIVHIRIPRIAAAFLLGAALSAAGAVFQTVFRNPLVDAGFLGVSQGAAFGASIAIVFASGNAWAIQGGAALFAFLGLGLELCPGLPDQGGGRYPPPGPGRDRGRGLLRRRDGDHEIYRRPAKAASRTSRTGCWAGSGGSPDGTFWRCSPSPCSAWPI